MRTAGESDLAVSGIRVPETLELINTATGEVLWEDMGYPWQSVSWSPGNNLAAIAYGGRTWQAVTVVNTAFWTTWEFTLPDGSPIPEYTFLPEDWGRWLDENTLLVTVGQGGRCRSAAHLPLHPPAGEDGTLSGSVQEQDHGGPAGGL